MEGSPYAGFYARFLGGFFLEFQGKRIIIAKNLRQKSVQLLMILLKAGSSGITRKKLAQMLEPEFDDWEKQLNNLRRQTYKLRKLIRESGFPEGEYIRISKGIYYFNQDYEVQSDVGRIKELYKMARNQNPGEKRISLLREICGLYRGEFLPFLMTEEWVIIESASCQSIYYECLKELCQILKERNEFTELLELCTKASELYPYDEWQAVQIDCLMAKNRYQEAQKVYAKATETFIKELGIAPFEGKMEEYNDFADPGNDIVSEDMIEIKKRLVEDGNREEAYYCGYPSFVDANRFLMRVSERTGNRLSLMLCTLTDEREVRSVNLAVMEQLGKILARGLRFNDVYTQYSKNQYLALLTGIDEEEEEELAKKLGKRWEALAQKEQPGVTLKIEHLEESVKEEAI